jgi:putative transport protein
MEAIKHILKSNPEIALFAALFLGYLLGKVKIKGFSLGGVAGSLMVALVIGQLGVDLPESLKAVCFALFIYSVGFKSGPEFFGGLNRSSFKLVLSATVQSVTGLIMVLIAALLGGFGKGFSVGIGAGALTETAMMGTAGDALARMGLPESEVEKLTSQMAIGFALTYVFGTVGVILFIRSIAPRLLGVDIKKAARELEEQLSEGGEVKRPGYVTPFIPVVARAFQVDNCVGCTVAELVKKFDRASVERILRGDEILEPLPHVALQKGDIVGLAGLLGPVVAAGDLIGHEVENKEALSFPLSIAKVVITSRDFAGKTLLQIRNEVGQHNVQAVYLASFKRQGLAMPILPNAEVRRGDIFELAGRPDHVNRAAALLGHAESPGGQSDLAYHALGIVAGTLLGLVCVVVGGIPLTLGVGGGVLVSGLCFGWAHTRYPVFGSLPQPAQWVLSEFGLSAFVAIIGLSAGPKAVAALQEHGFSLLIAGVFITTIPIVVALYFGRFVLK